MAIKKLDLILNEFTIIDGTGNDPYIGSLGIKDGKITKIKKEESISTSASRILNCSEFEKNGETIVITPGFIDMHSHSDLAVFMTNSEKQEMATKAKISQGITREVVGQDGFSAAPIFDEKKEKYANHWAALTGYLPPEDWTWNTIAEYLAQVNQKSITGIETLVGHSTLRINVMGYQKRAPTKDELDEMQSLLRRSLQEGAIGLSLGLIYPPGLFAKKEELIALAKVVAEENGLMVAHIRNESEKIISAAEEYLQITAEAKCRTHFSHLKVCGKDKLKKRKALLKMMAQTRNKSQKITFDMYPYDAGSTTLQAILPPWAQDGSPEEVKQRLRNNNLVEKMAEEIFSEENGDWDNFIQMSRGELEGIVISDAPKSHEELIGKNLAEIGQERGFDPTVKEGKIATFSYICKLLVETNLQLAMISYNQSIDIVKYFLTLPNMTIGTDGVLGRKPHPRLYGAVTKYLRMMRESGGRPIEQAVQQITYYSANIIRTESPHFLSEKPVVDFVILDKEGIRESNSYESPRKLSKGIIGVFVKGELVYPQNYEKLLRNFSK
ncbi:MAG: amidohydrolase family protein [Candidatus Heimdallarchaeota archaeon]|nr:amidohydrolase family protein [Candidatus Heimdallarchaeota archaeon]